VNKALKIRERIKIKNNKKEVKRQPISLMITDLSHKQIKIRKIIFKIKAIKHKKYMDKIKPNKLEKIIVTSRVIWKVKIYAKNRIKIRAMDSLKMQILNKILAQILIQRSAKILIQAQVQN
jgi:hypothetical protein